MNQTFKYLAVTLSATLSFFLNPAYAVSGGANVISSELFHDQGPLFFSPSEPDSRQPVSISIRCLHDNLTSATLKYFDEADKKFHLLAMKSSGSKAGYDYWQATIPAGKSRKHYRFLLRNGSSYAWYNAGGAWASEPEARDFIVSPGFFTPQWLKGGIIYQIFPDRFFDGDPRNNIKTNQYRQEGAATVARSWKESPTPEGKQAASLIFFGGDLEGVIEKLSYIRGSVGANIIYLNPIFESPTNHKYDTSDYNHVAACLGTDQTLVRLSDALHQPFAGRRGYLILDGVFNHSGDSNKWFGRSRFTGAHTPEGAYEAKDSPFHSYYTFTKWPDKYASFFGVTSMPKLNYGSAALRKEIYGSPNSVALRYLKPPFCIDGWRLDAPQWVDKDGKPGCDNLNHEVWRDFRKAVKTVKPGAAIIGEHWQDASDWIAGCDQWDSVTNFDGFTQPVSEWITGKNYDDAPARLSASEFDRWLRLTRARYPFNVQQCLSNHTGNHDICRFAQRANGDPGMISLALIFQMTYVGAPTIYYGDEYGMQGKRDPDDRRTFDWSQDIGKNELIALTHKLTEIRNKYPALRLGSFITLACNDRDNLYSFGRMDEKNKIAVVLNADAAGHKALIPVSRLEIPEKALLLDELSGKQYQVESGQISLNLGPRSGAILSYRNE